MPVRALPSEDSVSTYSTTPACYGNMTAVSVQP